MKNNFVAILDFGSSKVTCMAATKVAGRSDFVIRAVGQSAYNGFDDNSWYEPETISFAVTDAISQVEKKMDSPIKEIFVGSARRILRYRYQRSVGNFPFQKENRRR